FDFMENNKNSIEKFLETRIQAIAYVFLLLWMSLLFGWVNWHSVKLPVRFPVPLISNEFPAIDMHDEGDNGERNFASEKECHLPE
ncbi:hypothetical protein CDAR_495111, partial [Caerostris darwini]